MKSIRKITIGVTIFIVFSCLVWTLQGCGDSKLQQKENVGESHSGFAHNDYLHERPVLDAIDAGFRAVEADLILHHGQLLVGHDLADTIHTLPTLADSYLKVIREQIQKGKIAKSEKPFLLMLDFKSSAAPSVVALQKQLSIIAPFLTFHDGENWHQRELLVFISGNRPIDLLKGAPLKRLFIDGRPEDLESDFDPVLMPVVSDRLGKWTRWNGKGEMPVEDATKIKAMLDDCHSKGSEFRFWGIPDFEEGWEQLEALGVDWINTDKLSSYAQSYPR